MKQQWWHNKVAYQIYPKSFLDTTGSGTGDLNGVIEKLDYLQELGIDMIWLSPCFVSPFKDQGYDIADYQTIDPRFGSNEDLHRLISQAAERGITVLLDLVINHCSDQHPWFQQALKDPYGPYGAYFYFEKGKGPGCEPPNNWRSYFGGSVWEPVPGTDLYYLHLFDKSQPDLNWENQALRQEIYSMAKGWLEQGIAGFRLDAIMNLKKALPFKANSYQPDRADGRVDAARMLEHTSGLTDLLQDMKQQVFQPYRAFTVGEVFSDPAGQIDALMGDQGCFSTIFDFRAAFWGQDERGWYANKPMTGEAFKKALFETQQIVGDRGLIATVLENHDEPRGVSRYLPAADLSVYSKKMLAAIHLLTKGIPFIYQGQEIGMENRVLQSPDQMDDLASRDQYQLAINQGGLSPAEALKVVNLYSRDNGRTPMQWDATSQAGFTTGTPWLEVNPDYKIINVACQQKDPDSLWNWYRQLIQLRKSSEYSMVLVYGEQQPFKAAQTGLLAFYRKNRCQTLLVLANYQPQPQRVTLDALPEVILLNNYAGLQRSGRQLTLQGYQLLLLQLQAAGNLEP
ncbi:alpha-glucosidase [Oscillospiraceae bacterium HV4-5-C5C]|nr:alpha-glucosidase [Oscillospiraceae bacterium HV4-5-C5C]